MEPTTLWDVLPVIGFMADSYLDDLKTVGFKHFNPIRTFPTTAVYQNWEPMTFGMAPCHIVDSTERSKDALVSQSPIVVFKSCNMLQALGIVYSRTVLPSSDVKGETKGKTYCPATWNYASKGETKGMNAPEHAAKYADLLRQAGASSLLCQECILSVIAQLSNKSANHANCAFAESASTVVSGVMVSLTPCFKASIDRPIQFSEYAEFKDVNDMVQKLNGILSIPHGFPQIPTPRKDCRSIQFPPDKRNDQYVMRLEQECECLVYFADQSRSMIDVLGLGQDPFWDDRVKAFYGWYSKSGSKTSQDAWTWEGKDNQKWSTTRGASKRNQSVPANPADRTDPKEKPLPWRDIGDLNKDESYLYPGKETDPACPVPKNRVLAQR